MRITYWEQTSDFDYKEHEEINLSEAIQILKSHNWNEDLKMIERLKYLEKEWCPPGIGFVSKAGFILHICTEERDMFMVYYHYPAGLKFLIKLGLAGQRTVSATNMTENRVIEVIKQFFKGSHQELLNLC